MNKEPRTELRTKDSANANQHPRVSSSSPTEPYLIFCRRIRGFRTLAAHLSCPYCFGGAGDIGGDRYESFCDFQPGVDPIHFGFPETHGRHINA